MYCCGSGLRQVAGCFGHGNETLGFMKCREFNGQLRYCWLLKKDPAPWSCYKI